MRLFIVYVCIIAAMSVIAFFTYYADKVKARKGSWRIRETVLLGLGLLGGAAGALLSMNIFRHKTKHFYFWVINFLGLATHIAVGAYIFINFV